MFWAMRYLFALLLVTGCGKSVDQKQKDVDSCRLNYPTSKLALCLTTEHKWPETDAYAAQARQANREEAGAPNP